MSECAWVCMCLRLSECVPSAFRARVCGCFCVCVSCAYGCVVFACAQIPVCSSVIQKKENTGVIIPESFFGKKKNEIKETLTITKDGSYLWKNEIIDEESLKGILQNDSDVIVNIDEGTSIQKFNEVVSIFKSKNIKKIFISVRHKND